MSLLRNAFQSIVKADGASRPSMTPYTGSWLGGEGSVATNRIAQMQTYGQVSWLFAAVSRIAQAVASTKWKLYQTRSDGESTEVVRHPLLMLWKDVNPFDTHQEFLEISQQHLDLTGEAWWLVIRDSQGAPRELWALRPDRMRPIPHPTEFIAGYVYTIGANRVPLGRDDVIFMRMPSPLDPYRGMGPIGSLLVDIGVEHQAAQWTRNFFRNSAEPGGIIQFDEALSDADFERLRQRWAEQHQGVGAAHRVALLERGTWIERKYTQRDMQFDQLRRLNRDLILGAFGMPLPMVGIVESVNRANAEAAEVMFNRWVVRPRLERIKGALNTRLAPMFGDGLEFDYVDPTPENREQDLAEAERGYRAGLLTRNEGRMLLDQDPVEDGTGDEFYVAPGPLAFNVNNSMGKVLPEGLPERTMKGVDKGISPLEQAEAWMRTGWVARLRKEADALGEHLGQYMKAATPIAKIELADIATYDWDWWTRWGDDVVAEVARAFSATMLQEFPGMPPNEAQRLATEYAENRGARLLRIDGDLNMVAFTRERVNALVGETIRNGDSLQKLQKALREDLAFSRERARMVARTESATAQGVGGRGAAVAQGRNEKMWITAGDDLVDDVGICRENEEQGWIPMQDPFQSGHDQIPGHPNCRCNTIYRTGELHGGLMGRGASIPELRCPAHHLVAKDATPGAKYWCRKCKVDVDTPHPIDKGILSMV